VSGHQQLTAIIDAFRIAQPVGIYGNDQFLHLRLALGQRQFSVLLAVSLSVNDPGLVTLS
jgi:hypothetical protein